MKYEQIACLSENKATKPASKVNIEGNSKEYQRTPLEMYAVKQKRKF